MKKWITKRYIISIINGLIDDTKNKTDIRDWKTKIRNVIAFCNLLLEILDDEKITKDEAAKIIRSAENLVR